MRRIILVGKGASGKDYAYNRLSNFYKKCIKYTTRPIRKGESNNVDYKYISNCEFDGIVMLCKQKFIINGDVWQYGISESDFNDCELFILTPNEIQQIEDRLENSFIVFIDIPMDIRRERLLKREDINDDIDRRLNSDELDFSEFNKYDYRITNPLFDINEIIEAYEYFKGTF